MYMQGSVPSLLTGNYSMALLANRPHANENKKLKEQLQALGDRIESLTENQDIWQTGYVSMEGHAWELSRQLQTAKAETIKKYREKAAIKLAQNARSDYWHWIDDTLYEVEKEIVGEYR